MEATGMRFDLYADARSPGSEAASTRIIGAVAEQSLLTLTVPAPQNPTEPAERANLLAS
ncbi:hypothetical protein ACWD4G_30520 [Streptomyces sp. NPDC002643]